MFMYHIIYATKNATNRGLAVESDESGSQKQIVVKEEELYPALLQCRYLENYYASLFTRYKGYLTNLILSAILY